MMRWIYGALVVLTGIMYIQSTDVVALLALMGWATAFLEYTEGENNES